MVRIYRTIQQWAHWLTLFAGKQLIEAEIGVLRTLLANYYGKHAVLIGVPEQQALLHACNMPCQVIAGPMINKDKSLHNYVESELYELAFDSNSVDLVILPHTLEYIDNPRRLLAEACRIVKPEGHIAIFGFNPYSAWGLRKLIMRTRHSPWSNHFLKANTLKKWLSYADFELGKQTMLLFRPPIFHKTIYKRLRWLEWLGKWVYRPLGGAYVLLATAKVVPLTPTTIRLRWKQRLSALNTATRIPRPTARHLP